MTRQHTPHTHSPQSTARRVAWLVLGLLATAFTVFEVAKHGRGALALALIFVIAPDLTMLVGVGGGRELTQGQLAPPAVPFYNSAHRVWGPLALLLACTFWIDSAALFAGGLAWLAHVAIDRGAGFGLRTRQGFQRA